MIGYTFAAGLEDRALLASNSSANPVAKQQGRAVDVLPFCFCPAGFRRGCPAGSPESEKRKEWFYLSLRHWESFPEQNYR
jgi:hypothetical protein